MNSVVVALCYLAGSSNIFHKNSVHSYKNCEKVADILKRYNEKLLPISFSMVLNHVIFVSY